MQELPSQTVDISATALMCCTVSSQALGASETLLYNSTELQFSYFGLERVS